MCKHDSHNPVKCIIPPYISEKLLSDASKRRLPEFLDDELRNSRFRSDRAFFSRLNNTQRSVLNEPTKPAKKPIKKPAMKMHVYDMQQDTVIGNAKRIWQNGKPADGLDQDAMNVIAAGTATWKLYFEIFGRNSVDNLGMILKHYIHYGNQYDNAFWDGRRMVYGDGDGKIFDSFTADADIIGHELTHGVTQYESNLEYHNQSGALNESVSDVFGIMIKQRLLNQDVKQADWLIGENVLKGTKYALRSLKAPGTAYVDHPDLGTDPQPATYDKFVSLPDTERGDWGGVHINSGIPNFAFYVTAFNIGGFSWEKAGRIWYAALTDNALVSENTDFDAFKEATLQKADLLFGAGSLESQAVSDGWKEAKV